MEPVPLAPIVSDALLLFALPLLLRLEEEDPPKRFEPLPRTAPRLEIPDSLPELAEEPPIGTDADAAEVDLEAEEDEEESPLWESPEEEPPIEAVDEPPPPPREPRSPPPLLPPPGPPLPRVRLRSLRLPAICGAMIAEARSAEISPEIRMLRMTPPALTAAVRIDAVSTRAASLAGDGARFSSSHTPAPATTNATSSHQPFRLGFAGAGGATTGAAGGCCGRLPGAADDA